MQAVATRFEATSFETGIGEVKKIGGRFEATVLCSGLRSGPRSGPHPGLSSG